MAKELSGSNYDSSLNVEAQQFLGKIEFFRDLPQESIRLIDKRIRKMSYKKGEKIMSEFDVAKGVFFVHSGVVKLTKQDEKGNELIICIKKKGDLFAEACLFNHGEVTYPATGTMLKDGDIYFLNTDDLEQELLLSPELAVQLIRYMGESLRDMSTIMRDIALLDVYTKTIKQLERLSEKFGANRCNQMFIELPMTVQEFSTLIGATRESVSRVFSRLKKEGTIEIKEKKIIITDWCKFCHKKEEID